MSDPLECELGAAETDTRRFERVELAVSLY